jgi:hypothetical protein
MISYDDSGLLERDDADAAAEEVELIIDDRESGNDVFDKVDPNDYMA